MPHLRRTNDIGIKFWQDYALQKRVRRGQGVCDPLRGVGQRPAKRHHIEICLSALSKHIKMVRPPKVAIKSEQPLADEIKSD